MTGRPDLADAILSLRPASEFTLFDATDLATLDWLDQIQARPADADVMAELDRMKETPPVVSEPTPAEKLAAAGLTVAELRGLLGLPPA